MFLDYITVGLFEVNCIFLQNETTNETIIIDPGADADRIQAHLRKIGMKSVACLLTHGHMDHISAVAAVADTFDIPVYLHPDDAKWAFTPQNQMLPYYGMPQKPAKQTLPLADNQKLSLAGLNIEVLHTPGHSPGSVCFLLKEENILISGDTLFKDSAGRTDLPGGNGHTLARSLKRIASLPGNPAIYPGHGPDTTLKIEKRCNMFLTASR